MPRKLHVGNLDPFTTDRELEDLFASHGVVRRAQVMACRALGTATTSGLVEMDSQDESATAIAMLNGHDHAGRTLSVDWATDVDHCEMFEPMNAPEPAEPEAIRGPRPGDFGDRGGNGGSRGRAVQEPAAPPPKVPHLRHWSEFQPARWPGAPLVGGRMD